jgi:hypothetical protein
VLSGSSPRGSYGSFMTDECFTKVLGTRRGSNERRGEYRAEDAVVDVIRARAHNGGVTSIALQGATGLAPSQVAAALKTATAYLRVRKDRATGRWHPETLAR